MPLLELQLLNPVPIYPLLPIEKPQAPRLPIPGKSSFNVQLTGVGDKKIEVIKVVRDVMGKGLREAKDLVDAVATGAQMIKENAKKEEADDLKKKFEAGKPGTGLFAELRASVCGRGGVVAGNGEPFGSGSDDVEVPVFRDGDGGAFIVGIALESRGRRRGERRGSRLF